MLLEAADSSCKCLSQRCRAYATIHGMQIHTGPYRRDQEDLFRSWHPQSKPQLDSGKDFLALTLSPRRSKHSGRQS